MNDFSELEAELKQLRPAAASPDLALRIERALERTPEGIETAAIIRPHAFRINWLSLGLGLAAAAGFLLLARVNAPHRPVKHESLAAITPMPSIAAPLLNNTLVPAGLTQVVYNTRDEGLMFTEGAAQPVRRVRSRQREIMHWQNPSTGESLRVSYPSEEVRLIPVSGQ